MITLSASDTVFDIDSRDYNLRVATTLGDSLALAINKVYGGLESHSPAQGVASALRTHLVAASNTDTTAFLAEAKRCVIIAITVFAECTSFYIPDIEALADSVWDLHYDLV